MSSDAAAALIPQGVINALLRANGPDQKSLFSYIVQAQLDGRAAGALRRRKWILARIPFLPKAPGGYGEVNTFNVNFWLNTLTEDERHDAEIMYKLLECWHTHKIFASNPWRGGRLYRDECPFPAHFLGDPEAMIALTRDPEFHPYYFGTYDVPEQFRDNSEVMKAICSKIAYSVRYASPRLRDDEELVKLASLPKEPRECPMLAVTEYASDRLKTDAAFITDLFRSFVSLYNHDERTSHGWFWLKDILGPFSLEQMKSLLDLVPSEDFLRAIDYFPEIVLDDAETMLELMSQQPSKSGIIFGHCSKRVQKDERIVQTVKKRMGETYIEDLSKDDAETKAKLRTLEDIAAKKVKSLNAIPANRRLEDDVIKAAIEHGILHDEESVLAFINGLTAGVFAEEEVDELYSSLPDHLQENEAIAAACIGLDCSYYVATTMLEKMPRLKQQRGVMIKVVGLERTDCLDDPDPYLSDCPSQFFDDKEFMLEAMRGNEENLQLASERLFSDPDFVMKAVSCEPQSLRFTTPEFQLNNLDVVSKAIGSFSTWDGGQSWYFGYVAPEVWTKRSMVMKWLMRKSDRDDLSVLKLLSEVHPESPFLNDKEVVSLSVRRNAADFAYASIELRSDRQFVLRLAGEKDGIVPYCAEELQFDEAILATAFARNPANIVDRFDILDPESGQRDLKFLIELSLKIRLKLNCHDTFVREFLRGMAVHDQHTRHPSRRCLLPRLDRGLETSIDFKRRIAEYVGAPVGEEYARLKGASLALECFGLY